MGALIRISAAFGADAMVLGERSCDPFFRQSIRVSMGTVFRLPLVQSDDLMRDLHRLRGEYQVELAATVVAEDAEPLAAAGRGPRLGLLLGGEAHGLGPQWVAACDRRITIPCDWGPIRSTSRWRRRSSCTTSRKQARGTTDRWRAGAGEPSIAMARGVTP